MHITGSTWVRTGHLHTLCVAIGEPQVLDMSGQSGLVICTGADHADHPFVEQPELRAATHQGGELEPREAGGGIING